MPRPFLDKVILSCNLARNDGNASIGAREGLVYYAQNAKPILMTSIWIVILERADGRLAAASAGSRGR